MRDADQRSADPTYRRKLPACALVQNPMSSLKFALRTLFKTPFVTIIAIVSLALGIGANAAIFSCFNQMLLESLNVPRPARAREPGGAGAEAGLAVVRPGRATATRSSATRCSATCRRSQTVFTGIAAHVAFGANMAFDGQTMSGQGLLVSGNYFQVLQVQPALGRLFDSNDDRLVGEAPVVVLSHGFWTTKFAADPNVLNKTLIVNGQTLTIVGVAPRGVRRHDARREAAGVRAGHAARHDEPGLAAAGATAPATGRISSRGCGPASRSTRRAPGAERAVPRDRQRRRGAAAAGHERRDDGASSAPSRSSSSRAAWARAACASGAKTPLYLLLGVTGFVLLIACANIANLLLARSAARATRDGRPAVARRRPRRA